MKRFITIAATLLAFAVTSKAALFSTNVALGNSSLLLTNNCKVYQITLLSTVSGALNFYDTLFTNSLSGPYFGTNYVTAAIVGVSSYTTNQATSYVDSGGYTNWYTNSYRWTYTNTVAAATNQLPKLGSFVTIPNVATTYNVDWIVTKGLSIANNTNVQVILYYGSN